MLESNTDAYERTLNANLGRTIDFVRYGDGKNAALLTFTSAWLAGIGTAIFGAEPTKSSPLILVFLFGSLVCFFIGAAFSMAALMPQTDAEGLLGYPRSLWRACFGRDLAPERINLLYFGHIRTLDEGAFHDQFSRRYRTRIAFFAHRYARDVCAQTLINAKVAQRKFDWFDRAITVVFAGLFLFLLAVIIGVARALFAG